MSRVSTLNTASRTNSKIKKSETGLTSRTEMVSKANLSALPSLAQSIMSSNVLPPPNVPPKDTYIYSKSCQKMTESQKLLYKMIDDANNPTSGVSEFFPKLHKANIVVWSDLSVDAVDRLNESQNSDHIKEVLSDTFDLHDYKTDLRDGIKMDLYYYTVMFAKEQTYTPEKLSTVFSIIKKIFEVCIETPYGNLDHTFKYFKDLILCHSINRPPYSLELFSPQEVRVISEYTINTFFRHFKMYKYAFTPLVRLDLTINYLGMPPSPPPSESEDKEQTEEDRSAEDKSKEEEIDEEQLAAREQLKEMVREFMTTESKRIEGNVENHIKSAVASLNTQIDGMIETAPEKSKKKK